MHKHIINFVVLIILFSLISSSASAQKHTYPSQPIIVRGDYNYPPFEYLNEDGLPDGFNVEIVRAIFRAMDMSFKIDLGPWNLVRKQLEKGEIDVLAGMYKTEIRDKKVDFSAPHFISTYNVFVRNESLIKELSHCQGKTIVLQRGDLSHDFVVENNISTRLILEKDVEDVIQAFSKGEGDCAIVSRIQGAQLIKKRGIKNIRPLGEPVLQSKYCLAVTQGNSNLLAKINEGLFIIKTSGEFDRIYEKWFGAFNLKTLTAGEILKKSMWIIFPLLLLVFIAFICSLVLLNQIKRKTASLSEELAERKKAEERLKKSEQEMTSIFRAAPAGIGVLRNGIILQANVQLSEMTGFSMDELLGQSAKILYLDDESYEAVVKEKKHKINKWGIGRVETKWQQKNSAVIHVLLHFTPIDLEDRSKGITFTALDITYLKAKESELLESEKKYQAIMGSMKEPVYISSEDFLIEYMNPNMIKRTGYDATGKKCFEGIHGFDEKCPWCEFETIKKGSTHEMDIVSLKDDHSFQVSSTPIVHADGKVSMLNVLRDTTRMKQIEAQLQQAQKIEAVGVLAGGIAHDFNNILSGIFGYAKLAERHIENPAKAKSHIRQIVKGSQRAAELIQQILTFSRKTEPERQLLNLSTVVKEVLDLIRSSIPSSIEISSKILCDEPIMGDPGRIHQVIMNLCTNAFHAMPSTGVLTVEMDKIQIFHSATAPVPNMIPGKYLILKVVDTGHGMDLKTMSKIFDPYFTTKKPGQGTGLGLAMVYGVVEEHGGYVKVDSSPDRGSMFQLFFPLADATAAPQKKTMVSKESFIGGSERIMVVDDEESILMSTQELLKDYGYHVTAFADSHDAYAAFEKDPSQFDLVITDLTMPRLSGDELSKKILNIKKDMPIILCTGYSETFNEEKALELGIRKYVQKPIETQSLVALIREIAQGK